MPDAPMFSLEGKAALVTGAGRGIGRAISLAYARAGAALSIGARTESELDDTAAEIEKLGGPVVSRHLDMSDLDSIRGSCAGPSTSWAASTSW